MLNIVRFGPYRPHGFVPGDASPLLGLTSQNAFNMLEPALLIRPATQPSPADVGSHTTSILYVGLYYAKGHYKSYILHQPLFSLERHLKFTWYL